TIIESGIDIPQANTLIVERSDLLGLAQLYQLRGRVGRCDATSFAYLFYPDARELTPEARARLATLADHTELGAGFAIAMRDLEIRGAGELLGAEQSGHVAAVGFELYVELLNEAVAELQGQRRIAARPVRGDARIDATGPSTYVASEARVAQPNPHGGLYRSEQGSGSTKRKRVPASDRSRRCYLGGPPGRLSRRFRMKRALPILLLVALLAVLTAGCGGSSGPKSVPA